MGVSLGGEPYVGGRDRRSVCLTIPFGVAPFDAI
jgi:hypothetical protein